MLASDWDCALEPAAGRLKAVRLGLRQVKGLKAAQAAAVVRAREAGARAPQDFARLGGLNRRSLELLAGKLRSRIAPFKVDRLTRGEGAAWNFERRVVEGCARRAPSPPCCGA